MSYSWAVFQPLIGGMALGCEKALNAKPDYILSYEGISNDEHIRNYWKDVPYYTNIEDIHEVDIVVGVPVCSALSSLNVNSSAEYCSINNLYEMAETTLDKIKPKVAIFENAPALFTNKGKQALENLIKIGNQRNYSFSIYKTSTHLHGIPQKRERTFYFFWKSEYSPILEFIKRNEPLLEDYLKEIPKETTYQNTFIQKELLTNNPYFNFIKEELGDNFRNIMGSQNRRSIFSYCRRTEHAFDRLINFLETNKYEDKWINKAVYAKEKFAKGGGIWDATPNVFINRINAIQGRLFQSAVHPIEDRWYNIREYMHLMGLPSDFQLANNNYGQICQNVPVNTACDMILQVKKHLNNELKLSKSKMLKQNNLKETIEIINNNNLLDFI